MNAVDFRRDLREFLGTERVRRSVEKTLTLPAGEEAGALDVYRWLGERGWLAPSWPVEYGGLGATPTFAAIVTEELAFAGVPDDVHVLGIDIVGAFILRFGSIEQRRAHLPALARGERIATVLFTEPECGSDLARITTRAEPDGDGWRLRGTKVFNMKSTFGEIALCAVRTADGPVAMHGITLFLVPLRSAGVHVRVVPTSTNEQFNVVVFDGLRVTEADAVGPVDAGWQLIGDLLDMERTGIDFHGKARRLLDRVLDTATANGRFADDVYGVRLAEVDGRLRAGHAMAWDMVDAQETHRSDPIASAMTKWYVTEQMRDIAELGLAVAGPEAMLTAGDPDRLELGQLEATWRSSPTVRLASGTSEMMLRIASSTMESPDWTPVPGPRAYDDLFGPDIAPILRRLGERPRDGGPAATDAAVIRKELWDAYTEMSLFDLDLSGLIEVALAMGSALHRDPFADTVTARALGLPVAGPAAVALVDELPATDRISGTFGFVGFADEIDALVVTGSGRAALVPIAQAGVTVRRQDEVSRGEYFAITLHDAAITQLVTVPEFDDVIGAARLRQAAYLAGAACGAVQLTVARLREREAFGAPLIRVPTLTHRLAGYAARVAAVTSWLRRTATMPAQQSVPTQLPMVGAQALALAGALARETAAEAVHLHGADGLTEQSDAQIFFRHAPLDSTRLGSTVELYREAARYLKELHHVRRD